MNVSSLNGCAEGDSKWLCVVVLVHPRSFLLVWMPRYQRHPSSEFPIYTLLRKYRGRKRIQRWAFDGNKRFEVPSYFSEPKSGLNIVCGLSYVCCLYRYVDTRLVQKLLNRLFRILQICILDQNKCSRNCFNIFKFCPSINFFSKCLEFMFKKWVVGFIWKHNLKHS